MIASTQTLEQIDRQFERIQKPKYIKRLSPVDIAPLQTVLDRISEPIWAAENAQKPNNFDCFHHTQHIVFRFLKDKSNPGSIYANPIWAMFQGLLLPTMQQIASLYDCQQPAYPKTMLARLEAGQVIDPHVDRALCNLYTHKIHIPLKTNPQAKLMIRDQAFHLEPGYAYEVNNVVPHAVQNLGHEERIHFIFEIFDAQPQSKLNQN